MSMACARCDRKMALLYPQIVKIPILKSHDLERYKFAVVSETKRTENFRPSQSLFINYNNNQYPKPSRSYDKFAVKNAKPPIWGYVCVILPSQVQFKNY